MSVHASATRRRAIAQLYRRRFMTNRTILPTGKSAIRQNVCGALAVHDFQNGAVFWNRAFAGIPADVIGGEVAVVADFEVDAELRDSGPADELEALGIDLGRVPAAVISDWSQQ